MGPCNSKIQQHELISLVQTDMATPQKHQPDLWTKHASHHSSRTGGEFSPVKANMGEDTMERGGLLVCVHG